MSNLVFMLINSEQKHKILSVLYSNEADKDPIPSAKMLNIANDIVALTHTNTNTHTISNNTN